MSSDKKGYNNIISLGFFCSVALEIERMGLRDASMPFDWLISSWKGVETLIKNSFDGFLDYDLLTQDKSNPERYKNKKYDIWFFHDFNQYESLDKQLDRCVDKYSRRIKRFYKVIKEPTLFIRYIQNLKELEYLDENIEQIAAWLKTYNENNDIIFIANNEMQSDKIEIYHVEKDKDDSVSRRPMEKNIGLYEFLYSVYDKEKVIKNKQIYDRKQKRNNRIFIKYRKKIAKAFKRIFLKPYKHKEQI